jgi:hypothetical protein
MGGKKIMIMKERPIIICLTPVRNEAWILDRFLKAACLWADHVIIADQMSTDGSRDIAKKYPKVILIDNPTVNYNESERQKLLIDEARKIKGPRLLITLDADEVFTPNITNSPEWQTILTQPPGTIIKFQWANLLPDLKNMWLADFFPWGYMDDGSEHNDKEKLHSCRIPLPLEHDIVTVNQIKVIHFQYTDWIKMQSKHRWYQCYERITFPAKSTADIFRMYHHMYAIPQSQIILIPNEWIQDYNRIGIDITSVYHETVLWWDEKILEYIEEYGANYFRKLYIWDIDWKSKAKLFGKEKTEIFRDPRRIIDRIIQKWLIKTQANHKKYFFSKVDSIIRFVFRY